MTTSYPAALKGLHWASVVLLMLLFGIGWSIDLFGDAAVRKTMLVIHQSVGLSLVLVTLVRTTVRVRSSTPDHTGQLPLWMQRAATASHVLLYAVLIALPLSGWLYTSAKGGVVRFFWLVKLPRSLKPGDALADNLFTAHKVIGIGLLVLAGMHVLAALYHHFVRRDGVLRAMLPARKSAMRCKADIPSA